MEKGYKIFGKAYEIMLKNDLHDINSIDHKFMSEMILLNDESYDFLYNNHAILQDMTQHELYDFAQKFKSDCDLNSIKNVAKFTSDIANTFNLDFEDMLFGGTEKEIINRGTDWCADMARVAAVLLQCIGIPCRIVHLANIEQAYNGHVIIEAYYCDNYGLVDPIYGYVFFDQKPINAYEIWNNRNLINEYDENYQGLFRGIGINEYNPMDKNNKYITSKPNEYYLKLIHENHHNKWIMEEDK